MCSQNLIANNSCDAKSTNLDMSTCRIKSSSGQASVFQLQSGSNQSRYFTDSDDKLVATAAAKLKEAHNELFYMAAFIMPSDSGICPRVDPSWSDGLRYEDLADSLGKNAGTYPVCSDDYTASFDAIFELVTDKARRSYVIALDSENGEYIYRVRLSWKSGGATDLSSSQYSVSGNTLTLDESINVVEVDNVRVDIVVPFTQEQINNL
jgi:hypothetical protein